MQEIDKISSASIQPKAVVYHTTKVDFSKHLKIGPVPKALATLPGYGEAYDSCGTIRFRVKCDNDHYHARVNSCNRKECPVCYPKWASRQARKAAQRFWWIFDHQPKHVSGNPRNARHVSLGVPPHMWGKPYYEVVKWMATALNRSLRSGGGLYVAHPWRFRDQKGEEVQWKHSDLNSEAEAPIIDSWAVYGPHVHFVIFGWLIPVEEFEVKYGCRYTYHSATPTEDEVRMCIRYLLTHTGLVQHHQSLIWFGKCSYNRVVLDYQEKEIVRALCPICHAPMWRETPEGDWVEWEIEITRRHYKFKVIQKRFGKPSVYYPTKFVPELPPGSST